MPRHRQWWSLLFSHELQQQLRGGSLVCVHGCVHDGVAQTFPSHTHSLSCSRHRWRHSVPSGYTLQLPSQHCVTHGLCVPDGLCGWGVGPGRQHLLRWYSMLQPPWGEMGQRTPPERTVRKAWAHSAAASRTTDSRQTGVLTTPIRFVFLGSLDVQPGTQFPRTATPLLAPPSVSTATAKVRAPSRPLKSTDLASQSTTSRIRFPPLHALPTTH